MADAKTPDTSNQSETLSLTFQTLIALAVLIASFMYLYDVLTRKVMLDVLLATIIFAVSLVWLFSNLWKKK
ncbi:MAG TPA: hypothetical protein VI977_00260 [archaeon]|nr:hypothetical protein [archaeon]